jgi:hypothetical protein
MAPTTRFRASTSACAFAMAMALSSAPAFAEENSASKILKGMTDHLMAQASLSVKYDSDVEVVTPSLQKIQFTASGEVALTRPDKFRASRTGGYADVEIVSDGSAVTVHDRDARKFAQVQVQSGGFDKLVDKLRSDLAVEIPGADLLLSNAFEELTSGVLEGRVIGKGVVDGVECDHLAFRNLDTDWQIWIEPGERPLPRKYVITSKTLATGPQYTLRLRDWKAGIAIASQVFDFTPPSGSSRVERASLSNIDEIPAASTDEEFINARR